MVAYGEWLCPVAHPMDCSSLKGGAGGGGKENESYVVIKGLRKVW